MKTKLRVIRLSVTNCFLLDTGDGLMLVDTGYEYEQKRFEAELRRNMVTVKDIRYVFLTHHHDDHCGLTNYIVKNNPLVRVILHRDGIALLRKGENDKTRGGGYLNKRIYYLAKMKSIIEPKWTLTFPPYLVRDVDLIVEGDDIQLLGELGINGRILHTPGHTIDSISILLDDRQLIAGDAAMNFLQWAGTHYATLFVKDVNEYYRSWDKIIDSGAQTVFPSHGKPFDINQLKNNIRKIKPEQLVKFF